MSPFWERESNRKVYSWWIGNLPANDDVTGSGTRAMSYSSQGEAFIAAWNMTLWKTWRFKAFLLVILPLAIPCRAHSSRTEPTLAQSILSC